MMNVLQILFQIHDRGKIRLAHFRDNIHVTTFRNIISGNRLTSFSNKKLCFRTSYDSMQVPKLCHLLSYTMIFQKIDPSSEDKLLKIIDF